MTDEHSPPDFGTMNETDVREVIVRPLIERLGYRHGTRATIRTEVTLRYDRAYLGRKKPAKDPPLVGRADYICDAIPFGRWVIEVKAPNEELTTEVREQTHTYAAHPEIAASFFMISNGRRFELFRTSVLGAPILAWDFEDTNDKFLSLLNLVGPTAIERLATLVKADPGKPLGDGLASALRIIGGSVTYEEHTGPSFLSNAITGLSLPITGGFVKRTDDGRLHAHVEVASGAAMMPALSVLGLDKYDFYSTDEYVSSDVADPSIFQNFEETSIPKGMPLALPGFPPGPAPFNYKMRAFTEAVGFADRNRFQGTIRLDYDLSFSDVDPLVQMVLANQFKINLPRQAVMKGMGRFEIELMSAT